MRLPRPTSRPQPRKYGARALLRPPPRAASIRAVPRDRRPRPLRPRIGLPCRSAGPRARARDRPFALHSRPQRHDSWHSPGFREPSTSEESSREHVEPPIRQATAARSPARSALEDDRIESETPPVAMQREDHHEDEQKEVGPRPLALGVVQAEPQIQHLQRPDQTPQANEEAKD